MYYRRKIILALLQKLNKVVTNTNFQKYLFLYTKEQELYNSKPAFHFVPYYYGSFSFQSYADRRTMIKYKLLESESDKWIKKDNIDYISELEDKDKDALNAFYIKYAKLKGDKLIEYVYTKYPYYAINSKIAKRVLGKKQIDEIQKYKPHNKTKNIYTIGYEGISFEEYLNKLIQKNITLLIDVRRNALSMKYGFSKKQLQNAVEELGIKYIQLKKLGIESSKRQKLNTRKDYEKLFKVYKSRIKEKNTAEVDEILALFREHRRIALTCFEHDHTLCHRHIITEVICDKIPSMKSHIYHL